MFNIKREWLDDGVLKIIVNQSALSISYYLTSGSVKVVRFSEQQDYLDVLDEIGELFVQVSKDTWVRPRHVMIIHLNALTLSFHLVGNSVINTTYGSIDELDEVIAKFEDTHIQLKERTWYNGLQLHIARTYETALVIDFYLDGGQEFSIQFDDQATYDGVIEFLKRVGEYGGGGGGGPTSTSVPTFSPSSGTVDKGDNVTLSCSTVGATIHYTTDGSAPTMSSPTYSSPITIDDEMTIKAFAVATGKDPSRIVTATYKIREYGTFYKGWFKNGDEPLPALTEADVLGLVDLETGTTTTANSDPDNTYVCTAELYPDQGRIVWAYPKKFGEIKYYTDSLGKHGISESYTRQELEVDGEDCYIYVLTDPIAPDVGDEFLQVFTKA